MTTGRWVVDECGGSLTVSALPAAELAESPARRYISESTEGVTVKPTLNEADLAAIAAKVLEGLKPAVKPLHEMSDSERDAYANEVWARAGVIASRPNAGRTISGDAK